MFLYVDTVNGTRPAGAKPRPLGCTQTNYFARGEQVVFRVWGSEAATGDILSTENVKYAYVKIPGQPNMKLNWGAHGTAPNRVWFWTAAWIIPKDYPLGVGDGSDRLQDRGEQVRALRLRAARSSPTGCAEDEVGGRWRRERTDDEPHNTRSRSRGGGRLGLDR